MRGLQSLVDPIRPEQFISEYWCIRHLLVHQSISSRDIFAKALADLHIKDMLRYADEPVIVMHTTTDGRYKGSPVSKLQAFAFFESGMALYFNLSSSLQNAREWTKTLASDLGQVESRCKASLFITPAGWTTEEHFDPNENFTIQLRGRKRWNIAPNDLIKHPVDRFTCSDTISSRMSTYYAYETLAPPKVCCSQEMDPGSMLYVPRGYWHSVESLTESVSLNFCIMPETWVSFLMPVIERLLLTNADLREVATGVAGVDGLRRMAFHKLKRILPVVSRLVADMCPEQMFPEINAGPAQLPAPDDRILRNGLATVVWDPKSVGNTKVTITTRNCLGSNPESATAGGFHGNVVSSPTTETLLINREQLTVLDWMLERSPLSIQTVKSHFTELSPTDIDNFILSLIGTRLFYISCPIEQR
jgi:50S ribosomal protein L16 3-hydroxylase